PLQRDAGVGLLEVLGVLLHLDHVAVVHGRDHEIGSLRRRGGNDTEREGKGVHEFHLLVSWLFEVLRCNRRIGSQKIGVSSCRMRYPTLDYRYFIARSAWGFPGFAASTHR